MTKEEMYQQHIDEMFGEIPIEELPDNEVERIFDRMVYCLPNNGKLYKYRSIEGKKFEYAFDGLSNGYLWMANASSVNDDFDCAININAEKEIKDTQLMAIKIMPQFSEDKEKLNTDNCPFTFMDFINQKTFEFEEEKFIKLIEKHFKLNHKQALVVLEIIKETYGKEFLEFKNAFSEQRKILRNFNKENRSRTFVFSMADSYDLDNLWGYYADNNHGFCIEYDFNIAKCSSIDIKRKLSHLYKVEYADDKKEFSFLNTAVKNMLNENNRETARQHNKEMSMNYIVKTGKWKDEREWRILLNDLNSNKVFANIVSGLIIDYRVISSENGQKLIKLARQKDWIVKIRKMNDEGTAHIYENYI